MTTQDWRSAAENQLSALKERHASLRRRNRLYWCFSGLDVGFGVVAPILAGSSLLKGQEGASDKVIGFLVLIAAILTAMHKAYGCDAYQARCRKVLAGLYGLISETQILLDLPPEKPADALKRIQERQVKFHQEWADILA